MKRTITLGIGLLALASMALPTSAADLGRPIGKAPVVAPPPPVLTWTGFYIGLGLGGRWGETDWETTCLQPGFGLGCALFPGRGDNRIGSFDTSGFRVSGYFGYNWQFSNWLLGVEADFGFAENSVERAGIPGTHLVTFTALDRAFIKDSWDASLRGRLGWLWSPQALFYVTGGVSWLEKEVGASCLAGSFALGGWCAAANSANFSETMVGWTFGVGAEWMFAPNWIARVEYRYTDYTGDGLDLRFFASNPIDAFDASIDLKTHTAYFGIAYKF